MPMIIKQNVLVNDYEQTNLNEWRRKNVNIFYSNIKLSAFAFLYTNLCKKCLSNNNETSSSLCFYFVSGKNSLQVIKKFFFFWTILCYYNDIFTYNQVMLYVYKYNNTYTLS